MPKVTMIQPLAGDTELSDGERKRLDDWRAPLREARPRTKQVPDAAWGVRISLEPRASMTEAAKRIYLLLRASAADQPVRLARHRTASELGMSPEAFNSQLLHLARRGFVTLGKEGTIETIDVLTVPHAPTKYVKRDFRGNNGYVNAFSGVMVLRLPSLDGVEFPARYESCGMFGPFAEPLVEERRIVREQIAAVATGAQFVERLVKLYMRLFKESFMCDAMVELDEGLLLTSLYGDQSPTVWNGKIPRPRKKGIMHSASALRKAFAALEKAGLVYCHYPAMAIAVFPPNANLDHGTWAEGCMRAIDEELLRRGLANRPATLVAKYRAECESWGVWAGYEHGIFEAAKDLLFSRLHVSDIANLVEYFVKFQYDQSGCDRSTHVALRNEVPPTLAGMQDHIYFVYEQVMIHRGLVDANGHLLMQRSKGGPLVPMGSNGPVPTTLGMVRALQADWTNYLRHRHKGDRDGRPVAPGPRNSDGRGEVA